MIQITYSMLIYVPQGVYSNVFTIPWARPIGFMNTWTILYVFHIHPWYKWINYTHYIAVLLSIHEFYKIYSFIVFAVAIAKVPVWVYIVSVVVALLLAGLILIAGIICCRLHIKRPTSCIPHKVRVTVNVHMHQPNI